MSNCDNHDSLLQRIAFSRAKGLSGSLAVHLLDTLGDIDSFFNMSQSQLHNITGYNAEIFSDEYRARLLVDAARDAAFVRQSHVDALFIGDLAYPRRLRDCEDAPLMLYRYGNCNLDSAHVVGIVGTRTPSQYGVEFTRQLVGSLASQVDDLVIVSGLAYGIDITAHKAALDHNVPTVGVLAHDLQRIYPAVHRSYAATMSSSGGALVTEYPLGTGPHKRHFLARNRIIAGLCDCLVVVESDFRGGSMSTARIASEYNRDVFALPGRITDRLSHGTNQLIANHTAVMIQSVDDIIRQMGWEADDAHADTEQPAALFRPLSEDEQQLLELIKKCPEVTVNDICVRLGKSYAAVSDMLFQLELDDIIVALPGGRYEPKLNF